MLTSELGDLARKYRCDDVANSTPHGRQMLTILKQLEYGMKFSSRTQEFLSSLGVNALIGYSKRETSFAEFILLAEREKINRIRVVEERVEQMQREEADRAAKQKLMLQQQQAEREREEAERALRMKYELNFKKYGLLEYAIQGTTDKADFPKLAEVLKKVNSGARLSADEYAWLLAKMYFTKQLKEAHHKNEATFYAGEFEKSKDPWSAVNASGHFRKCNEAKTAEQMLCSIELTKIKDTKIKSALCTTYGGVKRDLEKWNEAINFGEQGHLLTPKDYRPCTLLGAINIEIGNYDLGRTWYDKAVDRGYTEKSVDDELRSIFNKLEKSKQIKLRNYLLEIDPIKYGWTKK